MKKAQLSNDLDSTRPLTNQERFKVVDTYEYLGMEQTKDFNPEREKEQEVRSARQYIDDLLFGSNGLQYIFSQAENSLEDFPRSAQFLFHIQEQIYGFLQNLLKSDMTKEQMLEAPRPDEMSSINILKAFLSLPPAVEEVFINIRKILRNFMPSDSEQKFMSYFENNFNQIYSKEYQEINQMAAAISFKKMKTKISSKYKGKDVELDKPTDGDVKKYKVYVKNDKDNVVKVNFGDPNMEIKRDDPERKKNFRARHNCDNPGPKWKPRFWSCKMWSDTPVSDIVSNNIRDMKIAIAQIKTKEPVKILCDKNETEETMIEKVLDALHSAMNVDCDVEEHYPNSVPYGDTYVQEGSRGTSVTCTVDQDRPIKVICSGFSEDQLYELIPEDIEIEIETDYGTETVWLNLIFDFDEISNVGNLSFGSTEFEIDASEYKSRTSLASSIKLKSLKRT